MNSLRTAAGGNEFGWTRVSSFKPYLAGVLLTAIVSALSMFLLRGHNGAWPLITAGCAVILGLIALNWKVVHQRGNEYRVATLFSEEVVTVEDVCMTVTNPGRFWTRLRSADAYARANQLDEPPPGGRFEVIFFR